MFVKVGDGKITAVIKDEDLSEDVKKKVADEVSKAKTEAKEDKKTS